MLVASLVLYVMTRQINNSRSVFGTIDVLCRRDSSRQLVHCQTVSKFQPGCIYLKDVQSIE